MADQVGMNRMNQLVYSKAAVSKQEYLKHYLLPEEQVIFKKYREHIQQKCVLDIGCGKGRTSVYLSGLTDDYTGVDYVENMIEICNKKIPEQNFKVCDARNMECFSGGQFDFVLFSYNGIDGLDPQGREAALGEIYRVLKPGGLFVFSSHHRNYQYINAGPKFIVSRNPITSIQWLIQYVISVRNHGKMKSDERFLNDYAIVNDPAHNFSLLLYYVKKKYQKEQLESLGFEVLEMYNTEGKLTDIDSPDIHSAWIHYVTKKISRGT